MSDLDFTAPKEPPKPAPAAKPVPLYNAAMALEFFNSTGKPETIAQGMTLFAENDKSSKLLLQSDKMYLLVDGEISLAAKGKVIGTVRKGEIFGEMASIADMPRSATATAKTPCRVIALDNGQFQAALKTKPEFALMLMSVMIGRIRDSLARRGPGDGGAAGKLKESAVFDKSALAVLNRALGQTSVRYERGKTVFTEGQTGVLMYVVTEGRLAVSIKGKVVEKIGPGGVFGEMALVDRATRLASVVCETDCGLLAIGRNTFLDLVKASPDFAMSLLGAVGERARFTATGQK
jgi:CRP-like cAMP-binding protein